MGFSTLGLQFLKAIVDLARGEAKPTTLSIWERENGRWSSFELIMSVIWRCRTMTLGYKPRQIVRLMINTTANELCTGPLGHTIDLVRNAKHEMMMSEENIQLARIFETCDIKWIGQDALDLGWAKWIKGGIPNVAGKVSYQSMHKNAKGEKSVVFFETEVKLCLAFILRKRELTSL
uniref:Uncharacterized protein n=1 Tax=Leersia perrieri TaxID=77586 RepID=A0A0D9XYU2_9ORYZ